jgi:DUF1680 family protein
MIPSLCFLAAVGQSSPAPAHPVPFTNVQIDDRYWRPRQQVNRIASVPHCLDMLEKAGNLSNFDLAARGARNGFRGFVFNDSDVYKVIQGAADTLAVHPDPALDRRLDAIIARLAKAQLPDGYLDTYYEINAPTKRFTNLRDNHELYCAGHLMEAAVAHYQATGKRNLLNIALKYANLLYDRYGPESNRLGYGGHPELELALVKLSRATKDPRYFALAQKLVMTRGSHFFAEEHRTPDAEYDGTYWIDDVPITEQHQIKGHAVRAAYLMSGATDVEMQTENPALALMLDRVWRNAVEKRVFVTGGIGPSGSNEGFTVDYDLPNETAYQETCASVAMAMWGYRMGLLHSDAHYFDAVENALDNAMLAGVALDGKHFFYTNPLASTGQHHRQEWFDCACCPPNALRTIAEIGGYAYAQRGETVFVNLYMPGQVSLKVGGRAVTLKVEGDYPYAGGLKLTPKVNSPTPIDLRLRIPGWCQNPTVSVNGHPMSAATHLGYVDLNRTWKPGDEVKLNLPMPVQQIAANPQVKDDAGRFAVRRGPLVYCAEQVDQAGPLGDLVVKQGAGFQAAWNPKLLGGTEEVLASGETAPDQDWGHKLYEPLPSSKPATIKLIPYAMWDNRAAGPMQVWLPSTPAPPPAGGPEARAQVQASFLNTNAQIEGVNDGSEPTSSGQPTPRLLHFWPHKGTQEWVTYRWTKPISVKGVRIYWFDDTGRGECRLPSAWHLEAWKGSAWVPVQTTFPVSKDKWCDANFAPVKTLALRLLVQSQPGWSSGVRQWRVVEDGD